MNDTKSTVLVIDDEPAGGHLGNPHMIYPIIYELRNALRPKIPTFSLTSLYKSSYNRHQGKKEKARRLKQLNRR